MCGTERGLLVAGPLDPATSAEMDQVVGFIFHCYKELGLHPDNSGESVKALKICCHMFVLKHSC